MHVIDAGVEFDSKWYMEGLKSGPKPAGGPLSLEPLRTTYLSRFLDSNVPES
jgi:hypothetical protein